MTSCVVVGCSSNKDSEYSFHAFPEEQTIRDQWFKAIKLKDEKFSNESHICSKHFDSSDFTEKDKLKSVAIPSKLLCTTPPPVDDASKLSESSVPVVDETVDDAGNDMTLADTTPKTVKRRRKRSKREVELLSPSQQSITESGSRPSRRAARVAAEKISDTVKKYNLAAYTPPDSPSSDYDFEEDARTQHHKTEVTHQSRTTPQQHRVTHRTSSRTSLVPIKPKPASHTPAKRTNRQYSDEGTTVTLFMECQEEGLSSFQIEAQIKAQEAYDEAMRKIEIYKHAKYKIIYSNNYEIPAEIPSTPLSNYGVVSGKQSTPQSGVKFLIDTSKNGIPHLPQPKTSVPGVQNIIPLAQKAVTIASATSLIPARVTLPTTGLTITTMPSSSNQQNMMKPKSLPLITGGTDVVTAHTLLAVKVAPMKSMPEEEAKKIEELGKQLETEKMKEETIPWLMEKKILPSSVICKYCRIGKVKLQKDPLSFDGYKWLCSMSKCLKEMPIGRQGCFSRFGLPLKKIIVLVYHWAVQSSSSVVEKDSEVDIYMIRSVWRALQEVCARSVTVKSEKLGGPDKGVEVSTAQLGRFLILGAYDRSSKLTRLKTVSVALGWNSPVFLKSLIPWLCPGTKVYSMDLKLQELSKLGFEHYLVGSNANCDDLEEVKNITDYLKTQLSNLFGDFVVNQLKHETVQGFLDELQWRERFGTTGVNAFWNILENIAEQGGRMNTTDSDLKPPVPAEPIEIDLVDCDDDDDNDKPQPAPPKKESGVITPKKPEEPPNKRMKVESGVSAQSITKFENEPSVVLDEYYYARKEPDCKAQQKESKGNYQFKCPVCKKIIDENIKIMRHITGHIESSRQKNSDLSDLTICKYCYRDFETPYSMQCHIDDVHNNVDGLACRICSQGFPDEDTLTAHMKANHTAAEMPYSCQLCGYRSSFHQEVMEHFCQEHSGSNCLLCHYCLKVYIIKFSNLATVGVQRFYCHLYKHQWKTSTRRCPICCLLFFTMNDLKIHKEKDHRSMKDEKGVTPAQALCSSPVLVVNPEQKYTPKKASVVTPPPEKSENQVQLSQAAVRKICMECKKQIEDEHFVNQVRCSQCTYTTYCSKAYADHMICIHSHLLKRPYLKNLHPFVLKKPTKCVCGFETTNGNNLAAHLVKCSKETVCVKTSMMPPRRPFRSAAIASSKSLIGNPSNYFPPLISLDDEDADTSEPFTELFSSCTTVAQTPPETPQSPLPRAPTPQTALEGVKTSGEKPTMLDALGLVRRPSSSQSPDTSSNGSQDSKVINTDESRSKPSKKANKPFPMIGPKSAKARWAAMGLLPEKSQPPTLEPENVSNVASGSLDTEAPVLMPEISYGSDENSSEWNILEPCVELKE